MANRVSEIQSQIRRPRWFHVKSEDNPADIGSRGLNPEEILTSTMWWKGPSWLGRNFTVPDQSHLINQTTLEAANTDMTKSFVGLAMLFSPCELAGTYNTTSLVAPVGGKFQDLNLTSDFERTVRVTVHIFRFLVGFFKRLPSNRVTSNSVIRFDKARQVTSMSRRVTKSRSSRQRRSITCPLACIDSCSCCISHSRPGTSALLPLPHRLGG